MFEHSTKHLWTKHKAFSGGLWGGFESLMNGRVCLWQAKLNGADGLSIEVKGVVCGLLVASFFHWWFRARGFVCSFCRFLIFWCTYCVIHVCLLAHFLRSSLGWAPHERNRRLTMKVASSSMSIGRCMKSIQTSQPDSGQTPIGFWPPPTRRFANSS